MLARELALMGNDVTLLTILPSRQFIFPYKKEIRDGVLIVAFSDIIPDFMRRTGFGLLSVFLKTIYVVFHSYDIYHSDAGHRPGGGYHVKFKRLFSKLKYVCEWWDYLGRGGQYDNKHGIRKYTQGKFDLLFEVKDKLHADGVVCVSHKMAELAKLKGVAPSKIRVINGGSDVINIFYNEEPLYREKYSIPQQAVVFGFIGMNRLEIRDILPFTEALNELTAEIEELKNAVVVTTGDQLLSQNVEVKFKLIEFGWLDYSDFSEVLNCVDLFVLTQKPNLQNETRWPNKLGDYIAAGRKTIINPLGDTRVLCEEYPELFFEVEYDKESIKTRLREAICNKEYKQDRRRIRDIAEQKLSWQHRGKELVEFYTFASRHS